MTAIISFSEETSREIAALVEAEGANVDQWLNRYVIDIHRAVAAWQCLRRANSK